MFTKRRLRMPPFSNAGRKQAFLVEVGEEGVSISGSLLRKKNTTL